MDNNIDNNKNKNKTKITLAAVIAAVVFCGSIIFAYDCGKQAGARSVSVVEQQAAEQAEKSADETTQAAAETAAAQPEGEAKKAETSTEEVSISPNPAYDFLGSGLAWQLSAESQGLIMQGYAIAEKYVDEMVAMCEDAGNTEWTFEEDADGSKRMLHNGVRVAIVSDVDDTLVDGANYTADVVGNDGDYNNAAFARFVMSDSCTALPGAVEFVKKCVDSGIDFYYVTNRYDQAYKQGQSDSVSSYEQSIAKDGKGLYCKADGTEIGSSLYQACGKTIYDISYESMERLGFPIDDQHLIVNDNKLNGSSKEPARTAIREGNEAYPNGQRTDGSAMDCATTTKLEPHDIVMLLGDNIGDFTDAFSAEDLDAVSRSALASNEDYAGEWGTKWIVMPNAMYGNSINYATSYGMNKLFKHYAYTD